MEIDLEWAEHPENPLIEPVWPEWLLGDPVVVPPEGSPDGKWHMFLNTVLFIYRYTSDDGIKWKRRQRVCRGMRNFIFRENGEYFMFYERHSTPWRSRIMVRRSGDLRKWSRPEKMLVPELEWEKEGARVVSCPCVVRDGGTYRLYYSAGQVFLHDLGFAEPKYVGVAESAGLLGPYEKRAEPIFGPEEGHPYRNRGAGAFKVYRDEEKGRWVGYNNGLYTGEKGRSRSAVMLLTSVDGLDWDEPLSEPIIMPTSGWKKALVYQLCMVERPGGEVWLYYNSRDGWRFGRERIGLEIGRQVRE